MRVTTLDFRTAIRVLTSDDVPPGMRPSAVEIRRNLADKCALVLLDDVDLPPTALGSINAYGPQSAWVFASEVAAASAQRRPVVLKGLPTDDGIALFERGPQGWCQTAAGQEKKPEPAAPKLPLTKPPLELDLSGPAAPAPPLRSAPREPSPTQCESGPAAG